MIVRMPLQEIFHCEYTQVEQLDRTGLSYRHLIRVVYTKSGKPTAAIIRDDRALIDHILYWIPCRDGDEATTF